MQHNRRLLSTAFSAAFGAAINHCPTSHVVLPLPSANFEPLLAKARMRSFRTTNTCSRTSKHVFAKFPTRVRELPNTCWSTSNTCWRPSTHVGAPATRVGSLPNTCSRGAPTRVRELPHTWSRNAQEVFAKFPTMGRNQARVEVERGVR